MLTRIAILLGLVSWSPVPALGFQEGASWARFGEVEVKQEACGAPAHAAIVQGLRWLVTSQSEDGFWSVDGMGADASVGNTALALLALLGDGNTRKSGEFQDSVSLGVTWLAGHAAQTGSVRELALATLVLTELRQLDGDSIDPLLNPVLDLLFATRTKEGAWPERSGAEPDAVATSWAAQVLGALPPSSDRDLGGPKAEALAWIKGCVEPSGKVSLSSDGTAKERGAAVLLLARVALGARPKQTSYMERQQNRFARGRAMPSWDQQDLEYWYAASTSQALLGGDNFKKWWPSMIRVLLDNRNQESGHWEAIGSDSSRGEVRSTALAILTLEAPYRLFRGPGGGGAAAGFSAEAFNDVIGIGGGAGGKFGGRFGGRRNLRVSGGGGTSEALAQALEWLADNQSEDGSWKLEDTRHPVGCTGLALLALMGDGNTTRQGPYKTQVLKGVAWLRKVQDQGTGCFASGAPDSVAYEHAIATQAIAEAHYFSKSPLLRVTLDKAVAYCIAARNPDGVWSYDVPPAGVNNTSVTAWMFFALKSAEQGGAVIDEDVWDDCAAWLDAATNPATGRVGYRSQGGPSSRLADKLSTHSPDHTEALTGAALLCRFFLDQDPRKTPAISAHAERLLKALPELRADGSTCDMMYWYFGSYAMFQMGGKHWSSWNKAMKAAVVDSQEERDNLKGSWAPVGPWGDAGGRVYSTAMMALTLEVYFRYAKVRGPR